MYPFCFKLKWTACTSDLTKTTHLTHTAKKMLPKVKWGKWKKGGNNWTSVNKTMNGSYNSSLLTFGGECEWEAKCLPVVLWPLWFLCWLGSGKCRLCDAGVSIMEERQPPPSGCYVGQRRLSVDGRDWWRAPGRASEPPTSQRCNPSRSPCTCSAAPLLSCSASRSLNDLQISLIFQGPKPFRVLPGSMVGLVLTLFLCFFLCYPPMDHRGRRKQQRSRAGVEKVTGFSSLM